MNINSESFDSQFLNEALDPNGPVPTWVFDIDQHRIIWANEASLPIWRATSVRDILDRDFSTDSQVIRTRLAEIYENGRAEGTQETWTLHPNDMPITVVLNLRPFAVKGGIRALKITALRELDLSSEPGTLRLLEASRYTTSLVSLYSLNGAILAQNPASVAYCRKHELNRAQGKSLSEYFADKTVASRIVAAIEKDLSFEADLEVVCNGSVRVHAVLARRGRDPVGGEPVISVTEQDITERAMKWRELSDRATRLETGMAERASALEHANAELQREVEERKRAEVALRDQIVVLQSFLQAIPAPVFYKDNRGRYLDANDAFAKFIGVEKTRLAGHRIDDFVPAEVAEICNNTDARARETDRVYEYELSLTDPEGNPLEYVVHKAPFKNSQSSGMGVVGVMMDISQQKQSEAAIKDRDQRLSDIAKITTDLFWELDADQRFCFISDRCEQITGAPQEAFLGKRPDEVFRASVEQNPALWQTYYKATQAHEELVDFVHNHECPRLGTCYLSCTAHPVFDEKGNFAGYRGASKDVTQIINAMETLKANQAHLSHAQRMMDLGVLVWRANQQSATYQSDNISKIYGIADGETSGWVMTRAQAIDFVAEDDRTRYINAITRAEEEQLAYDIEFSIQRADGQMRTLREIGEPSGNVRGVNGQIVSTLQDVTNIKMAERHLRQAQKMEALGKLTGGIAHDFNNLLAIVQGSTEFMKMNGNFEDDLADDILHATSRGAELTASLLAYARKQPLHAQPVHLGDLARGLRDMLQRALGAAIAVDIQVPEDLWPAFADPGRVEDAILNLAINARDAMPKGGRLVITCENRRIDTYDVAQNPGAITGEYATVSVTDTGFGMSEDVQTHAMEPFYTTKATGEGSGLGLSTIYGFARQSGGFLSLSSRSGHGTSVRLFLPRHMRPLERQAATPAPSGVSSKRTGQNVLLVEDNDIVRRVTTRILMSLGYNVDGVADAEEFHRFLKSGKHFDVVVCDVILPGGTSGPQLINSLRSTQPDIPVIFVSGYAPEVSAGHGLDISREVLIAKPFTREALGTAIREALEQAEISEEAI
ncbi:PAS domain-containing protein [Roseobacter sp. EG26]|uniref:PAS domain-containing protein n=1 Tax=Roseobacter sp. EG26 TaxID=3412477 RepID=UPI003CE562F9